MSIIKRKTIVSTLICLFFLCACDEKPKNPAAEYGDAVVDSYKRSQQVAEKANLDAVKKAVQLYYAANEKFPKSLDKAKDYHIFVADTYQLTVTSKSLNRGSKLGRRME